MSRLRAVLPILVWGLCLGIVQADDGKKGKSSTWVETNCNMEGNEPRCSLPNLNTAVIMPFVVSQASQLKANMLSWDREGFHPCNLQQKTLPHPAVDLVIYISRETKEQKEARVDILRTLDQGQARRCFGKVLFRSAQLSEEQDTYGQGPGLMFFGMFDHRALNLTAYDYILYMEPDTRPIREHWLTRMYLEAAVSHPFYVKGSAPRYRHRNGQPIHINGNAIYRYNDPRFHDMLCTSRGWFDQYQSFDQSLRSYIVNNEMHDVAHKYIYTEYIMSMGGIDAPKTLDSFLDDHPGAYLVHSKEFVNFLNQVLNITAEAMQHRWMDGRRDTYYAEVQDGGDGSGSSGGSGGSAVMADVCGGTALQARGDRFNLLCADPRGCKPCPEGYEPVQNQQCRECEPGYYQRVHDVEEFSWKPYTYRTQDWQFSGYPPAQCTPCPAGTYSHKPGAMSPDACKPCPAGMFSREGSAGCTNCEEGTYATGGQANHCERCPKGHFTTGPGAGSESDCKLCPPHLKTHGCAYNTPPDAAQECDCCAGFEFRQGICRPCLEGHYKATSGCDQCVPCPRGALCHEGHLFPGTQVGTRYRKVNGTIVLRSDGSKDIVPCPIPELCLAEDKCADERQGDLCLECAHAYSPLVSFAWMQGPSKCIRCADPDAVWTSEIATVILAFLSTLLFGAVVIVVSQDTARGRHLYICLEGLQVLALSGSLSSPLALSSFLSALVTLDISGVANTVLACTLSFEARLDLRAWSCPLIITSALLLDTIRPSKYISQSRSLRWALIVSNVLVLTLPLSLQSMFVSFNCFGEKNKWFHLHAPSLRCPSGMTGLRFLYGWIAHLVVALGAAAIAGPVRVSSDLVLPAWTRRALFLSRRIIIVIAARYFAANPAQRVSAILVALLPSMNWGAAEIVLFSRKSMNDTFRSITQVAFIGVALEHLGGGKDDSMSYWCIAIIVIGAAPLIARATALPNDARNNHNDIDSA